MQSKLSRTEQWVGLSVEKLEAVAFFFFFAVAKKGVILTKRKAAAGNHCKNQGLACGSIGRFKEFTKWKGKAWGGKIPKSKNLSPHLHTLWARQLLLLGIQKLETLTKEEAKQIEKWMKPWAAQCAEFGLSLAKLRITG